MENRETVIIVHGTWAKPKPDGLSWYQTPGEQHEPNFVSKLNKALEACGSPARCWAHCKDNSEVFSWSGDNTWIDRSRASLELAAYLNKLQADGWRCHVVAHSHGGNVVAEALPQLQTLPDRPTGLSGTITTLGAPFIDPMSPIANKMTRRRKILNLVAWSLYSLFIGLCLYLLWELFDIYLFGYHSLKIDMRIHGGLVFFWLFVTIQFCFQECFIFSALTKQRSAGANIGMLLRSKIHFVPSCIYV